MRLKRLWIAALLLTPPLAAMPVAAAAQASRARDLEVLTNFFLPSAMLRQLIHDGCTTKYRIKLATTAIDQAVERKLPGIHARMLAAAAAYCEAETPNMLRRRQDRIRADWSALPPADLSRLAKLYGPAAAEATAGATVASRQQVARLDAAQIAFAKTPGGTALINRASAYQRQVQPAVQQDALGMIKGGLAASHRAANAFAREKRLPPPYPNG